MCLRVRHDHTDEALLLLDLVACLAHHQPAGQVALLLLLLAATRAAVSISTNLREETRSRRERERARQLEQMALASRAVQCNAWGSNFYRLFCEKPLLTLRFLKIHF